MITAGLDYNLLESHKNVVSSNLSKIHAPDGDSDIADTFSGGRFEQFFTPKQEGDCTK